MSTLISITPPGASPAAVARHPLEPLSAGEVRGAVDLLKGAGKVNATTRFVSVSLLEPDKALVHRPGGVAPPRRARAVLFDNAANACYEASLCLDEGELLSWEHVPGVQPSMTLDEQVECEQAVLNSPEFRAKLKEHTGIDDTSLVMVDIWSAGNYGAPEDSSSAPRPPALLPRNGDPTDNGYAPADRGAPAGRGPEHDGGHPRRGPRPMADPPRRGELRGRPRGSASGH